MLQRGTGYQRLCRGSGCCLPGRSSNPRFFALYDYRCLQHHLGGESLGLRMECGPVLSHNNQLIVIMNIFYLSGNNTMKTINLSTSKLLRSAGSIIMVLFAIFLCSDTAQAQCNGCPSVSIINCSGFNTTASFVLCCKNSETLISLPASANCADTVPISVSPCTIDSFNGFSPALPPGVTYTWDPTTCTLSIY